MQTERLTDEDIMNCFKEGESFMFSRKESVDVHYNDNDKYRGSAK